MLRTTLYAALASSPIFFTEPAQAFSVDPITLETNCRFYKKTLANDASMHFKGAPTMSAQDMAFAGATTILTSAHDALLTRRSAGENVNSDITSPRQGELQWTTEDQSVTITAPGQNADTTSDYCHYLTDIAQRVSALSSIPPEALMRSAADGAIRASRSEVDTHSGLILSSDIQSAIDETTGQFAGIGIELEAKEADYFAIRRVMPRNPADAAGLLKGDRILAIDGKTTANMGTDEFMSLVRGEPGSKLTLSIKRRDSEPFDTILTRDIIYPEIVTGNLIPATGTATVAISVFNNQTVPQFITTIARLAAQAHAEALAAGDLSKTLKAIIPDVSNNPGGLKNTAELLNDLLVDAGSDTCLPLVASGKDKTENIICADNAGFALFVALQDVAEILLTPVSATGTTALLTPTALLYPRTAAEQLPKLTKIGTIDTVTGHATVEPSIFHGLNHANIFEVLRRLADIGARDKHGNIIIKPDVIDAIMSRATNEQSANNPAPGLQIKTRTGGTDITALTVPAAIQNTRSASASEITTGILADQGVPIIGPSYGKGSVQHQFHLDADGNIIPPGSPGVAALQLITTAAFFPGASGGSNHGVGIPGMKIVNGDFRDERPLRKQSKGLVPDHQLRNPADEPRICSLKHEFSGALHDTASIPAHLLTTAAQPAASGIAGPVTVFNTPLACALAAADPANPSPYVTIEPGPHPEPKPDV